MSQENDPDLVDTAQQRGITFKQMEADFAARESLNFMLTATHDLPGFAGGQSIWIRGGGFAFKFWYSDNEALAVAQRYAPQGVDVNYLPAKYSRTDLVSIQKQIITEYHSAGVQQVNWDVQNNVDKVSYLEGTSPDVLDAIARTYGDKVTFEVGQENKPVGCNSGNDPDGGSRYNCVPMRGGIELQKTSGSHDSDCSMTMWAVGNSSGNHVIISAAHCFNGTDPTVAAYHAGIYISDSAGYSFSLPFPISDSRKWNPASWTYSGDSTIFNKIYYNGGTPKYDITDHKPIENIAADDLVCKDGVGDAPYAKGTWCGGVITPDSSWSMLGHPLGGMQADFNGSFGSTATNDKYGVTFGDSGATVFYNHKIFGDAVTLGGNVSYWDGIESDLNVTFCTTGAC